MNSKDANARHVSWDKDKDNMNRLKDIDVKWQNKHIMTRQKVINIEVNVVLS